MVTAEISANMTDLGTLGEVGKEASECMVMPLTEKAEAEEQGLGS